MKKTVIPVAVFCLLLPVILLVVGTSVSACPAVTVGDTTLVPGVCWYEVNYRGRTEPEAPEQITYRDTFKGKENDLVLLWELSFDPDERPDLVQIWLRSPATDAWIPVDPANLGAYAPENVAGAMLQLSWKRPFGTYAYAGYYFE